MSKVVNKKALAETLAAKCAMTKKASLEVVDIIFDEIIDTLKEEGKVDISGFGKFEVKTRAARTGINPRTKEAIQVAETKAPGFKAAKALKEAVK